MMRFVTNRNLGILGYPDSTELWTNIINHIPDSVLLNLNVKILNVACGHCTEADVIVKRLKALGVSSVDIKNRIYVLDKYRVFTNYAKLKGYTNIITCDFLEWETTMKFDVIVGNPPYTSGTKGASPIWQKFISKCLQMTDRLAFIVPNSLSRSLDYTNIREQINNRGISSIQMLPDNTFENVNVSTLYFITDPTATKHQGVWFDDAIFSSIIQKIENICGQGYYNIPAKKRKIVFRGVKKSTQIGDVIDNLNVHGFNIIQGYQDTNTNAHRIVTSYLPNHKHHLIVTEYVKPGLGIPTKYRELVVNDKDEGLSVISYLKCKLPLVIHHLTKTSRTIDGPQTRFIPDVPFDRQWHDFELYRYFSFTPEEIKYIETNDAICY